MEKVVALVNPKLARRPAEFLGLGCLASMCRKKGYEVCIIDATCQGFKIDDVINELIKIKPLLVGITITEFSMNDADVLLGRIKEAIPFSHITVGGYFPSFNIEYMLNTYSMIDSVLYGEGEETFAELVDAVAGEHDWHKNLGIAYRLKNEVIINPPHKLIENLDDLPFPARDTLEYIKKTERNIPHMYSSRGCQGRCEFCSIHPFYCLSDGKYEWRSRSPKNVVDEMEKLKREYGCNEVVFFDDNFIGPGQKGRERAMGIADELKARGLCMSFSISTRCDNVYFDVFQRLKEVGLKHVFLGVESGVQRILNIYKKGIRVGQINESLRILKELNISTEIGFIMFSPFITFEEILENLTFLKRHRRGIMITTLNLELEVYRGQKIEKTLRDRGLLKEYREYFYHYSFEDKRVENLYRIIKEKEAWFLDGYNRIKDLKRYTIVNSKELREEINNLYDQVQDFDFEYFEDAYRYVSQGGVEPYMNQNRNIFDMLLYKIEEVEKRVFVH